MNKKLFVIGVFAVLNFRSLAAPAGELNYSNAVSSFAMVLNGVAWSPSNFLAAGTNSTVVTSPLISNPWTSDSFPTNNLNFTSGSYGNGIVVDCNSDSRGFSSTSGHKSA